ncbi:hypothetical protein ACLLKL_002018 [Escherichia coli]
MSCHDHFFAFLYAEMRSKPCGTVLSGKDLYFLTGYLLLNVNDVDRPASLASTGLAQLFDILVQRIVRQKSVFSGGITLFWLWRQAL